MKKLGIVINTTSQGNLLVRGKLPTKGKVDDLRIGSTVVTKKMKKIGRVYDIIGPVQQPYVTIKPNISDRELQKLHNEWVYIM
ncbi:MAG: Gar1/Naf1 family protein [Halobacteriota archaeon]|nr:Gar1/Naf1 family protein [Halobacteriota archaeon]